MFAIAAAFIATLTSGFVRTIATSVLFFLALKALLVVLFIVVLPIILNNLIYGFIDTSMIYINSLDIASLDGGMSFTGFLGWILECFKIPECISISIAALQLHMILKMIPFSPVR